MAYDRHPSLALASRSTRRDTGGFSFIEVLIAMVLLVVASMAGIAYVTRSSDHSRWTQDRIFARQKALAIITEMQTFVEGGGGVAADLDGFDDGITWQPNLTIAPDPTDPGAFAPADGPISRNTMDSGVWRWYRQIWVRHLNGIQARDLRVVTVRIFRARRGVTLPGEKMADVSAIIRTAGDAYPSTQVHDIYLLAIENIPGWWVHMEAIQPFFESALIEMENRNPGLEFRTHWITKSGYGRDEEYAPYTNKIRDSRATAPWTYVYPGTMPAGSASGRYYVSDKIGGHINLDGQWSPSWANGMIAPETFNDANGNGRRDPGETYDDDNGNGQYDIGNPVPYALADMHNNCMRHPEAEARFQDRVANRIDEDETPTWRLLLDRMILDPDKYRNAILVNLHGELLPMPPVRNYSDAAKIPAARPGWRAVTHPELLRPLRVAGNATASDTPAFRVYAYKTLFDGTAGAEQWTTLGEPYLDINASGTRDPGEAFHDWNGNAAHDASIPISLVIPGGDFTGAINASASPSLTLKMLAGGVDTDGNSVPEDYTDWANAVSLPEQISDTNGDGIRQVQEEFLDLDGNGVRDPKDPWHEVDGDGNHTKTSELLDDKNGNGRYDRHRPSEPYTDANGNGVWDNAEPYWDYNANGKWDPPTTSPAPAYKPWDVTYYNNSVLTDAYIADYGEPFLDRDGDGTWDDAEVLFDCNGNGVHDGGYEKGEMFYVARYDAVGKRTLLELYGTPLECNEAGGRGLKSTCRLYDLDYVPCPTPDTATGTDRFERDLYSSVTTPVNTARWRITLPPLAVRANLAMPPGANNGDATDKRISIETRFGTNLATGTRWPVRVQPQNLSRAHCYYHATIETVPFSERYQFIGDPRHSPYADTDAQGTTAAHGYNWYFDDFRNGAGDFASDWLAFDTTRMKHGWRNNRASGHDLPRLMYWLRTAVTRCQAVYTTLTGYSYYYMSIGGDVGYDSANGYGNSIPMDGRPFGLAGDVYESTITGLGTDSIRGTLKYVRSNQGINASIRSGGSWWSKPWMGEIFDDRVYTTQWAPWGNMRAAEGTTAGQFHLDRRQDMPGAQLPRGTNLTPAQCRVQRSGCTSFFNIGTSTSTFHHRFSNGWGNLDSEGTELSANYSFPLPDSVYINRPFGLALNETVPGDEFSHVTEYPRFVADLVTPFYNHPSGSTGSGLVRLTSPPDTFGNTHGGYVVVNGIAQTIETGSAFMARYSLVTLIHSFLTSGKTGNPSRIKQLPRVSIESPTLLTEIDSPATIDVMWSTEWKRWDGRKYTESYADTFTQDESNICYLLLYSPDNGTTWRNMLTGDYELPGKLPRQTDGTPDPTRTRSDVVDGGNETYTWATPPDAFPQGSYRIRIEAHRVTEPLHYAHHMEKIYVDR